MDASVVRRISLAATPLAAVAAAQALGQGSAGLAGLAGAWLAGVSIREWVRHRNDPRNWPHDPVLRGEHPARCALLVEVDDVRVCEPLCRIIAAYEARASFFLREPDPSLEALLTLAGEVGAWGEAGPAGAWWRPTGARPGGSPAPGRLAGHTQRLTRNTTLLDAQRVVGTDLVVVRASLAAEKLGEWLRDWDRRAVFATTLTEALQPLDAAAAAAPR
jgi:hypothetical protein